MGALQWARQLVEISTLAQKLKTLLRDAEARRASTQPRSAPGSQRAVPCAASSTPDSVLGFVPLLASLAGQSGTSATPPSLTIMCRRSEFIVVQSLCASVN